MTLPRLAPKGNASVFRQEAPAPKQLSVLAYASLSHVLTEKCAGDREDDRPQNEGEKAVNGEPWYKHGCQREANAINDQGERS